MQSLKWFHRLILDGFNQVSCFQRDNSVELSGLWRFSWILWIMLPSLLWQKTWQQFTKADYLAAEKHPHLSDVEIHVDLSVPHCCSSGWILGWFGYLLLVRGSCQSRRRRSLNISDVCECHSAFNSGSTLHLWVSAWALPALVCSGTSPCC